MSQQDFNEFKLHIKKWMDAHPKEYNSFENEMEKKSNVGYLKIVKMIDSYVPEYKQILSRIKREDFDNVILDIETLFEKSKIGEKLVEEFHKTPKKSLVPTMLAWIYYGKAYERMVERGEEIRKNPQLGSIYKIMITLTINFIVKRSIKSGLRTKEDWVRHKQMMKLAESDDVVDWAIDGDSKDENKKAGRKPDTQILPEDKLTKIGEILKNSNTQYGLACLKIALEEMNLSKPKGIKAFREALYKEYGENIEVISERGIQDSYKGLTSLLADGTPTKNHKDNREYIDQIIEFLSK